MKLLHFHLPKTGGTALRSYFVDQLGEEAVTPPLQGMLNEALLRWQHAAVISGHFIARQGDRIPEDRMAVSVLRSPVDRFLSEYQYNKFDIDHLLVDAAQRAGNLEAYLGYLQRTPTVASLAQMEMLYPLGTDAQQRLTTEEKLAASLKAVDHFELIGIQEEMEDFCSMLCAKHQWPFTQSSRVNVTSRRLLADDLSPDQRRAIEKLLEPEIILYGYAHARFKQDRRRFISAAPLSEKPTQSTRVNVGTTTLSPAKQDFGDLRCKINTVEIIGRASGPGQVMTGEMMDILLHVTSKETLDHVIAGIAIKDELGSLIFGTNSQLLGEVFSLTAGQYLFKFTVLSRMSPGTYFLDTTLTPTISHYDGCFHWRHDAAKFDVIAYATQHFEGRVLLDVDLNIEGVSQNAMWHRKPAPKNMTARAFGNTNKPLTDFHSSLEVMSTVDSVQHDSDLLLQVRLTNHGVETLIARGRYPVKLSYRWLTPEGQIFVADGLRSDLPCDIQPGSSVVTFMHVRTPDLKGQFLLATSLVQEHVAWFIDRDKANGMTVTVAVI